MTTTMELTDHEMSVVLNMRALERNTLKRIDRSASLLQIAHDLFLWQRENGALSGITYSMFTDDYGVSQKFDLSKFGERHDVFKAIMKIIDTARELAEDTE